MVAPPYYDIPPRGYGGIELMLAALVDALVERGTDVSIICAGENGTRGRTYTTLERAQEERLGEAVPEILHGLLAEQILADLRPDVIHDHTSAGLLAAPSRTRPTLATTHGPVTGEFGQLYASVDPDVGLVAISDAQRRTAPQLSWAGRVHNGLATADWPFREDKDDYVLFLGRFAQDKGLHVAIDVVREAGLRLVVAGGARGLAEQRYVDEQVRPRLGPDVELFGEASYEQKQELLARARCLIFPILWEEPFGMVQVEAMATGTPVVTLRRGSAPEVVTDGETGFIVDSIDQLPSALHRVSELDPTACRRRVEKNFDVCVMAAGYEELYARAADRWRPARAA
jgi:glycosyltransferase involved in cell wall biosynthesis